MREMQDEEEVKRHINEVASKILQTVLIIDGTTLDTIIKSQDG